MNDSFGELQSHFTSYVAVVVVRIILLFQEHRQNIYAVMQRKSYFRKKTNKNK